MQEDVLVSVVIPTYNRPIYLKRCIESVLEQTYKNIEIIVVDDNDPETEARRDTKRIVQTFISNYDVKYIQHEKNRNGSAARNTGWKNANGKYITFLDDDDVIVSTKIEKQVYCMEQLDNSWGACYTGYEVIKPNGTSQISTENRSGNCYLYALMRTMFMGSGSNLFLRKVVVDEVKGYDETFVRNQDIEFLTRVLEKYKLAFVDEMLLRIYQQGERTPRTFEQIDEQAKCYLKRFSDRINCLEKKDRERVLAVISLERCRVAVCRKKYTKAVAILIENKVKIKYIFKYIFYLLHRVVTKQSYGFVG